MIARGAGWPFVLAATVLLCAPSARAAFLCVVRASPSPGLEAEALDPALALERRKWDLPFDRVDAATVEACPAPLPGESRIVLVVGPGATGRLVDASGTSRFVDLETTRPCERASEMARFTVALMPSSRTSLPPPLVPGPLTVRTAAPAGSERSGVAARLLGYAEAGGWYAWQREPGLHAAGLSIEAGVAAFDERLLAGVRIGYQPPRDSANGRARVSAVPLTMAIHGGFRWSAARLRAVLEGGVEIRHVEVAPPAWQAKATDWSTAGILGGELEAVLPVSESLRVGLAATVRGYVGGQSLAWNGERVYRAPSIAVGAAVRLGGVFPRVRPEAAEGRGDGYGR